MSEHSVTLLVEKLKTGDEQAAQEVWSRFFHRIASLANRKLEHVSKRMADEEDVASKAMKSLLIGVKNGKFPKLYDRNDLWQILAMLVDRKARDQKRAVFAKKRGGGEVRGESCLGEGGEMPRNRGLQNLPSPEPSPEFIQMSIDEIRSLMERLRTDEERLIAQLKFELFTNAEIAEKLGTTERTIERKLAIIRASWKA